MKYAIIGLIALLFLKAGWDRLPTNNINWDFSNLPIDEWSLWGMVAVFLVVGFGLLLWGRTPAVGKKIATYLLAGAAVLAVTLMFLGPTPLEYRRQQAQALVAGESAASAVKPLSPEGQTARLERTKQEGEVFVQRAASEAKAQAVAEAARRQMKETLASFPTHVVVPHCDDGWSKSIVMVSGWNVAWRWPGRVFGGAQYMKDGRWHDITAAFTPDADAFRFCGASRDHLRLTGSKMPVAFTPK